MALVKCPECGREKVSDSAETCPDCGYAIKAYYDKVKQEAEEKCLAEEREQQRIAEEEERKRLQEEKEKQHQENMNKYFGTPMKKLGWGVAACIVLALVIMFGMYIDKENKIAEAISLPEGQKVGAVLAIGYPAEEPNAPRRKPVEELLTFQ